MHRPRTIATVALGLALGLVATACGQDQPTVRGGGGLQSPTGDGGTEATGAAGGFNIEDAEDHGAADLSGQSETSLELDDFYFQPTVMMGDPGQSLNIELENEGNAPHTFTLADGSVDEELQPGDKVEVDVTFPDQGHLSFECRFHAGQGMIGALSVEGDLGATAAEGDDSGGDDSSGSGNDSSGDDDY